MSEYLGYAVVAVLIIMFATGLYLLSRPGGGIHIPEKSVRGHIPVNANKRITHIGFGPDEPEK